MLKPGTLMWSDRVLLEFFSQGDTERAMGMTVSPMMDRNTVDGPQSQINFLEIIVFPLFRAFVQICPELHVMLDQLLESYRAWKRVRLDALNKKAHDLEQALANAGIDTPSSSSSSSLPPDEAGENQNELNKVRGSIKDVTDHGKMFEENCLSLSQTAKQRFADSLRDISGRAIQEEEEEG